MNGGDRVPLLCLGPDARSFIEPEELHVDDVRVAADRAVLDVLLLCAARWIERNDDLFAAGGTDVTPFVR